MQNSTKLPIIDTEDKHEIGELYNQVASKNGEKYFAFKFGVFNEEEIEVIVDYSDKGTPISIKLIYILHMTFNDKLCKKLTLRYKDDERLNKILNSCKDNIFKFLFRLSRINGYSLTEDVINDYKIINIEGENTGTVINRTNHRRFREHNILVNGKLQYSTWTDTFFKRIFF